MRAALSILGLVMVLAIVMFTMKKQAQQLVVKPGAAASAANANTPEAVRQQLQSVMDQAASAASAAQP